MQVKLQAAGVFGIVAARSVMPEARQRRTSLTSIPLLTFNSTPHHGQPRSRLTESCHRCRSAIVRKGSVFDAVVPVIKQPRSIPSHKTAIQGCPPLGPLAFLAALWIEM